MITLSSFSQVFAVEIGSTQDIVNKGVCPANIWYRKNGVSIGVLTHMVGFYEDGQFRITMQKQNLQKEKHLKY